MSMKKHRRIPAARWVAVSGGFDPIHIGHVRMFKAAKKIGDKLVVIVNNDNWLKNKKGFVFMPERERIELIKSFPNVDRVVLTDHAPNDPDRSVVRTLRKLRPTMFANGGDRDKKDASKSSSSLNPEQKLCEELGIKVVYGVGHGGKVQSSSWMIRDATRSVARSVRPWGEFYAWDSGKTWHLKTINVKPNSRLSLQYHHHRSEYWILVQGDATATRVENGIEKRTKLKVGETFTVPKQMPHRLTSKRGGILVEVAIGRFDEDDIVHIEDDDGRIT